MKFPTIANEARGQFDEHLFRTDVDEQDYRQYARENDPPPTWEKCEILHPYCRDEWFKIGVLPTKTESAPKLEPSQHEP